MTRRRLEAEAIRDAMLAVSGDLEPRSRRAQRPAARRSAVLAGQSRPGNGWATSDERTASRRSVYVYVKRTLALPELEVLDAADNTEPCPRRSVTTTAPQALTLLNGTFLNEQAGRFADRLVREAGDSPAAQVERAVRAGADAAADGHRARRFAGLPGSDERADRAPPEARGPRPAPPGSPPRLLPRPAEHQRVRDTGLIGRAGYCRPEMRMVGRQ